MLPKTLLEVGDGRTILDHTLGALAKVGVSRARLVVGHAADVVGGRLDLLENVHGVGLTARDNPHHDSRNNAYSLALGLEGSDEDVFVVNGDTLFDVDVLERLATAPAAAVTLAVDRIKVLGDEEMKVRFDDTGVLTTISKAIDPAGADGEYIGVARVAGGAIPGLVAALQGVWRRDASLYYEDAFGDLATGGAEITMVDVGDLPWIEVDTPYDLERARLMSWPS